MMKHTVVALATAAGIAGFCATGVSAFPANTPSSRDPGAGSLAINAESKYERDNASVHSGSSSYQGTRCDSWSETCRYRHGAYYYDSPWWAMPIVGAGAAIGAASDTLSSYPESGYSTRHVRWCDDRYRSYNARTNTWVSNSGQVRQCVSPYYGP